MSVVIQNCFLYFFKWTLNIPCNRSSDIYLWRVFTASFCRQGSFPNRAFQSRSGCCSYRWNWVGLKPCASFISNAIAESKCAAPFVQLPYCSTVCIAESPVLSVPEPASNRSSRDISTQTCSSSFSCFSGFYPKKCYRLGLVAILTEKSLGVLKNTKCYQETAIQGNDSH